MKHIVVQDNLVDTYVEVVQDQALIWISFVLQQQCCLDGAEDLHREMESVNLKRKTREISTSFHLIGYFQECLFCWEMCFLGN